MQVTVYDGADTIGGNKILLEDQGVNLFFDFGINFNLRNQYFEEYLVPRSRRGFLDMFHIGFLSPLRGIYRQDLEIPGLDIWSRVRVPYPVREIELHGILLSHAHLDHSIVAGLTLAAIRLARNSRTACSVLMVIPP